MAHASKILTTIIHRRLEQTIESLLDEVQFGFRKERGTKEALHSLQLIQSDRLRVGKLTFIAFVDLEQASDNVSRPNLFYILKNKWIKYRNKRIISFIYRDQKTMVKMLGSGEKQALEEE